MESGVVLDQFMCSPLVTWVKTFLPPDGSVHLDFPELMDGIFLNDVMNQINPPSPKAANKVSRDPSHKVKTLNFLVQQVKTYYLDHLRQLIMIPVPNVWLLTKTPYCEQSLDEMKKLLLLLLGCAVQCEKKEEYIERIQTLDFDTKAAIAVHIQELTHSQENVLDLQWLESSDSHSDELETLARNMAVHLKHLLDQREAHLQTVVELTQEKDSVVSLLGCPSSPQCSSCSPGTQRQQQAGRQQHLAVELADFKAKIRRLRQELEEKNEQMLDCRHELGNVQLELKKIQQENSQLLIDARAARTYRDELDSLRERAIKADKLESEVGRYREQLHKIEFFKAKVEELKEDNRVIQETKEVLEDQLEGWRARSDKIHHLEKQSLLLKAQIHDLEQDREADQKRIEELQEENLSLCLAQRRSMEESQHLGWELEQLSKTTDSSQSHQTLSEEVSERARSRLLKLEKENQSLLRTIEDLRVASVSSSVQVKSAYSGRELVCPEGQNFITCNGTVTPCANVGTCERSPLCSVTQVMNGDFKKFQEAGQLESGNSCDHFQELISDVEILEENKNRHHHCVASHDRNASIPAHEGHFTALPTRYCYANKQMQRMEAKCRNLDSLNQHLQTSLDNTERKVQHLEAEIQELEGENHTLHSTLEELRMSARRLEQLEVEKLNLEQENTSLEKDKRLLEKENRRLRQQTEIQEANLDSRNICMTGLEREMRLLVKEVESLRETAERVKGLERDNRELTKQAAIDQRTLVTLREELVSEKLKTQQKDNELESLAHELEVKMVNQESKQQHNASDNRFKMLESQLELSLKKSLQIKEDKMAALEARLQDSSNLNQQLRQELKTVRMSYEALQQRQEEEGTATRTPPPKESGQAMSEMLRESHEATKELLKLKDHLIEVERNNATLEAERQAIQAHVRQLQNQSDSLQAQILALQRQAASLQESNTALQTHNANLQVEKSTLNSQSASLMAQNAQLQQQQSGMEAERENAVRDRDEQRGVHEQLLRDHERLAALHERQAMEYETVLGKHACLKNAHRTLELEYRTLQDRYNSLLLQRSKLEDLEKALKEEQMRIALEKEQHRTSAAECCRLRDEKDWLNQTYRQLLNDNEVLTADHKQLKSELNEAKLEHTWLEADFNKLKKEYQQLDISSTKLTNQCELLSQLKGNLEEENRHLIAQIETLMLQNRTLLEQTMESKDLFHVEERQYIDKLNDLRRQKEKLEEKIMDQYKFYEPSPPRRRGNWITLKLKKLIKSSSREHGLENTLANSDSIDPHLYSGSIISSDGSTSAGEVVSPQHRSSTRTLKLLPRMRSRQKNRDRVKSLFQRSMSLSSLVFPSGPSEEERWSDEQLEASGADVEEHTKDTLTPSLTTSIISIHHPHPTSSPSGCATSSGADVPDVTELWVTDKDSNDSAAPSGPEDDEPQNHGLTGVQSRAQSESSGEYSLDSEPWSNNSSPIQQLPSQLSSSSSQQPCDSSTPLGTSDKEKASTLPLTKSQEHTPKTKTPVPNQDFWLTRGTRSIRRGSKSKLSRQSSESGGVVGETPELNKAEGTQTSVCSPITVLYVQGRSSSMSGCLNCFSTPLAKEGRLKGIRSTKMLPRASSVISTADGSSRRSSVNSDCRVTAEPDALPEDTSNTDHPLNTPHQNQQSDPVPPVKPPRDPTVIVPSDCPKSPIQESLMGSSFTFNSVFSNTIFSDSVVTTHLDCRNLVGPNTNLEQQCQTLHREEAAEESSQTHVEHTEEDKCVVKA